MHECESKTRYNFECYQGTDDKLYLCVNHEYECVVNYCPFCGYQIDNNNLGGDIGFKPYEWSIHYAHTKLGIKSEYAFRFMTVPLFSQNTIKLLDTFDYIVNGPKPIEKKATINQLEQVTDDICHNCGGDGLDDHTCPYSEECGDGSVICNCCNRCTHNCAQST